MRARVAAAGTIAGALLGAVAAALAYVLASPPYDVAALAWLAPALLLLPAARLRGFGAALPGLVFGLAIAVGITSWASHAVLAYFDLHRGAAGAFAVLVWLLYGGLPYALLTLAYAAGARRLTPALRPALAAWLWVAIEMLRSLPPLGLPWGLLSHTQWRSLTLIQIADLAGAYGVTFVVVLVSVSLGLALRAAHPSGGRVRAFAGRAAPAALLLVLVLGYGTVVRSTTRGDAGWKRVAVVQGNVPNAFRWNRAHAERNMGAYVRLTSQGDASPSQGGLPSSTTDLIVWPENAVDFYLDQQPMLLGRLRALAERRGSALLLGAPRLAAPGAARNSAYLIDAGGELRDTYDKRLLVPFAESSLVATATAADGEPHYGGGERGRPLASDGLSLGVLICFEVLFPDLVRATVRDGANLLVNISNDSWMDAGDGAAPRQHFAMAVLRAVEMRRTLVRASAGGVSGFVAPGGEVYDVVPWGESGASTADVVLQDRLTPYARFGEAWVLLSGVALLVLGWCARPEAAA